jgi:hypothetical protein
MPRKRPRVFWSGLVAVVLCGCFKLDVPPGRLLCVDSCPDGMECIEGRCYPEGWERERDAAVDGPLPTVDIADLLVPPAEGAPDLDGSWPFPAWGFRKTIAIDMGMFKGSHTEFPVLIPRTADPDLAAHAQPDGADLLFTLAGESQKLAHEVELYQAGTLVAWVKLPACSETAGVVLLLYYGNPSASSQQDPTQVWTNGFEGVWHMNADPTGQVPDSTGRHPGASRGNMTGAALVAGRLGQGIDFDGIDDALDVGAFDVDGSGSDGGINLEAWVYTRSGKGRVVSKATGIQDAEHVWMLALGSADQDYHSADFRVQLTSVSWQTAKSAFSDKTWTHVAGNFSTTLQRIYVDGAIVAEQPLKGSVAAAPTVNVSIGNNPVGAKPFDGVLDEVRISRVGRSAAWIHTQLRNHNHPETYITFGAEEPRPF